MFSSYEHSQNAKLNISTSTAQQDEHGPVPHAKCYLYVHSKVTLVHLRRAPSLYSKRRLSQKAKAGHKQRSTVHEELNPRRYNHVTIHSSGSQGISRQRLGSLLLNSFSYTQLHHQDESNGNTNEHINRKGNNFTGFHPRTRNCRKLMLAEQGISFIEGSAVLLMVQKRVSTLKSHIHHKQK